ncbi:MAG: cytochrome c [Nitrospirota bacterium]|jgi:mono/diheme cytochrome c family protein
MKITSLSLGALGALVVYIALRLSKGFALASIADVYILFMIAALLIYVPAGDKGKKGSLLVLGTLIFFILLELVRPLIPRSLLNVYNFFILVTVLLYFTSKEEGARDLMAPIKATLVGSENRTFRTLLFAVIPLFAVLITFNIVRPSFDAPAEPRSIHPAPPSSVNVFNKSYNLLTLKNPLRDDTANYAKNVKEGGEVYFKNCFYCHGDKLDGKGHFYQGFNPQPLPFMGTDTIAQLSESFVFWRVATGGPGLPKEGAPWVSAMPIWEHFLTEEEVWKVSMFIYDYSGNKPRTF